MIDVDASLQLKRRFTCTTTRTRLAGDCTLHCRSVACTSTLRTTGTRHRRVTALSDLLSYQRLGNFNPLCAALLALLSDQRLGNFIPLFIHRNNLWPKHNFLHFSDQSDSSENFRKLRFCSKVNWNLKSRRGPFIDLSPSDDLHQRKSLSPSSRLHHQHSRFSVFLSTHFLIHYTRITQS